MARWPQRTDMVGNLLCPFTILIFDLISLFLQVLQTTILLSFYEFGYLDSICKWDNTVFALLWLAYFS